MADFKTHVTFGAATGYGFSLVAYASEMVENYYMAVIIFFTTFIGSFLPDMDSESGLPIQIIFGINSFFIAGLTFYFLYNNGLNPYLAFGIQLMAFPFVRKVMQPAFKKYTKHRGVFHSIPAMFIAFFAALFITKYLKLGTLEKFTIAASIGLGYFSHLLLDEIYAVNFLTGNASKARKKKGKFSIKRFIKERIGLKKSFGTALDLGSSSRPKYPTILAYLILIVLIVVTYPQLKEIIRML